MLERAPQRGKRPPQLIWLKVASFGINIHKQVAVFEQRRKFGKSYAESISSRDRICRRIRIFTTKITHSAFFIGKRQQNQSACLTAVKPRILEMKKSIQNLFEIAYFDVFDVANEAVFMILIGFCNVFATS